MVLMASFFLCIKMTLLFFYKRLFLVTIVSCLFTRAPCTTPLNANFVESIMVGVFYF